MFTRRNTAAPDRRRRRLIGLGVLLVLTFAISGVYLAISERRGVEVGPPRSPASVDHEGNSDKSISSRALSPIERTGDPREFAVAVVEAVFDWTTESPVAREEYIGRVLAVAEPSGTESPGLVADLQTYLPTESAWADLTVYLTRQWLEVESVETPSTWSEVSEDADVYGVAEGTTAYTITGVRHRAGVWDDRPVETTHDVSLTVFITCRPTYPTCYLLRLSQLDEPLP